MFNFRFGQINFCTIESESEINYRSDGEQHEN